jgi:hypothetical protein
MEIDEEIKRLKVEIFSDDWEKMKASADQLFEIGGQNNIDYLLGLLDHRNSQVRNVVALTFRKNKFNESVETLLSAIRKEENRGNNGTLVYALEELDCSHKLCELFDILFFESSWEVKHHILTILDKQIFEFTEGDLMKIKSKWEKIKDSWNDLNKIDKDNLQKHDLDKDLIQSFVDGYVSYLKKS